METAARAPLDRHAEAGRSLPEAGGPPADAPLGGVPRWRLSPNWRKLVLATHIMISVGLFGVYAAMLMLGVAGATAAESETSGAAYRAMGLLKNAVPPGAVGVVVTGVILSVGTSWGLFTHLWVVVKLLLTVAALPISILLVFPSIRRAVAAPASESAPPMLVVVTGLVALSLGAATAIAVYKPWGPVARRRRAAPPVRTWTTPTERERADRLPQWATHPLRRRQPRR